MTSAMAFLFPGQGAQSVGMGRDLYGEFSEARRVFQQADEICGKPLSRLCFEGPMSELTLTVNLQPAVTAVSLACLEVLRAAGHEAHVSAGHSLGEYSALVSAGVFSAADGLSLVRQRGALMQREAEAHPGAMTAIIGLDIQAVEEALRPFQARGVIAVANHNSAEQIVITGDKDLVAEAAQVMKAAKGKAIPLKVSGAWHCAYMQGAVAEFRSYMNGIPFRAPAGRIFFNATAAEAQEADSIRDIMAQQLVSRVRWYDIVRAMLADGVRTFVEIGPGNVLTGLLKKIAPKDSALNLINIQDAAGLRNFLDQGAL